MINAGAYGLLGMWPNTLDTERLALDREIETPVLVDTSLPHMIPLIKFFGVDARMAKIPNQAA